MLSSGGVNKLKENKAEDEAKNAKRLKEIADAEEAQRREDIAAEEAKAAAAALAATREAERLQALADAEEAARLQAIAEFEAKRIKDLLAAKEASILLANEEKKRLQQFVKRACLVCGLSYLCLLMPEWLLQWRGKMGVIATAALVSFGLFKWRANSSNLLDKASVGTGTGDAVTGGASAAATSASAEPAADSLCLVCYESVSWMRGARCPAKEKHFLCQNCFCDQIKHQISLENHGNFLKNKCFIVCQFCPTPEPVAAAAAAVYPYSDADIALHADAATRSLYRAARDEVIAASAKKSQKEDDDKIIMRLQQTSSLMEQRISSYKHRIENDFLTYKCPSCKTAVDFDTFNFSECCMAIKCQSCPVKSQFCGWCFKACGNDAHPHVRQCKLNVGGNLFTTKDRHSQVMLKIRVDEINKFISAEVPPELQEEVRKSISKYLR